MPKQEADAQLMQVLLCIHVDPKWPFCMWKGSFKDIVSLCLPLDVYLTDLHGL